MAKIKTAKDILMSTDFLEARQKAAKYINHEFQDYAYRLACDLGDLSHLGIYMKLAKTTDRALLEQAAAFALGYFDEPNKGKIFMWKVSKIKRSVQRKLNKQNLEHDFIMSEMAKLMDELSDIFTARQKSDFNHDYEELLSICAGKLGEVIDIDKDRILILGSGIGLEARYFSKLGFKTFGMDISNKIVKKAKKLASESKIIRKKHFLENKYKDDYFAAIFIPKRFWTLVPFEAESEYLREMMRVTRDGANLIIGTSIGEKSQQWEDFQWNEEDYIRFTKTSGLDYLKSSLGLADYTTLSNEYLLVGL